MTARNFSAHKAPPRGQFHFTHSQTEFQTTKSHPSVGHQEIQLTYKTPYLQVWHYKLPKVTRLPSLPYFCILTRRAVSCPVTRLTTLITGTWWSRPPSRISKGFGWRHLAIFCPMPFLATFETGRTTLCPKAFDACIGGAVITPRSTNWEPSWYSLIIAPFEKPTRTSLNHKATTSLIW